MTGPAQTPMNLLKGGGSGFFSDACKALLQKAGYDPDDFGSYDHTLERLQNSRLKVKAETAAKLGDKARPDQQLSEKENAQIEKWKNEKPPAFPPTDREKELGQPYWHPKYGPPSVNPNHYQAGHLKMNTTHQGSRNDPCTNVVDGHSCNDYPCMPHKGMASDPNSEHGQWTADEYDVPENSPKGGSTPMKGGSAENDAACDKRLDDHLKRQEEKKQGASGGGANAPSANAQAGVPGQAAQSDPAMKDKMAQAKKGQGVEVDGQTAAECINNFRKLAEAQMKSQCQANSQKGPNGEPSKYQQTIAKAEAKGTTKAKIDAAHAKKKQENKALFEAREKKKALDNDPNATKEQKDAARREVKNAKARAKRANANYRKLGGNKTREAYCMQPQGENLANGSPNDNPRYPTPRPEESGGKPAAAPSAPTSV